VADDPGSQASGRCSAIHAFQNVRAKGNDYAFARYQSEVKRLYDVLEKRLGKSAFLGAEDFSIADIATFRGRAITTPTACASMTTLTSPAGSTPSPNGRGAVRVRKTRGHQVEPRYRFG